MEWVLLGRFTGACVVVGLVLFALQFIARRAARRSASPSYGGRIVAVLETTTLPGSASLHVVRVAERYVLVGRSASSVSTLCEIPSEHVSAVRAPQYCAAPARGAASAFAAAGASFTRRALDACRSLR